MMKTLFTFLVLMCLAVPMYGDEKRSEIPHYVRDTAAKTKFQLTGGQFCFWYNRTMWKPQEVKSESWKEYPLKEVSFKSTSPNIYGTLLVAEEKLTPEEAMQIVNARTQFSFYDVKTIMHEKRNINGQVADCFLLKGYFQGINENLDKNAPYYIYIYYFIGKETVVLSAYSREDVFFKEHATLLNFLSGMEIDCSGGKS